MVPLMFSDKVEDIEERSHRIVEVMLNVFIFNYEVIDKYLKQKVTGFQSRMCMLPVLVRHFQQFHLQFQMED
jgi:hypothetical protein